jgi:para-aminobenzoate synthetase / 4-amino-4-deoxychorismate lyase
LLWNERRELTESCIANLVVEWDGQWYTPPVHCGLLAGTFRAWLLQQGKVQERIIRVEDLASCSRIWLVNSVRQMQEGILWSEIASIAIG